MPSHWTYTDCCPEDDLEQGDIILPTEQLKSLFARVHQHFCDPKYVGFVVLTQSCDLVRRDDDVCKARYIALAVVRELHTVLCMLLDAVCDGVSPGVYASESKAEAKRLLSRVVNQNEQVQGLFYLHDDYDAGIIRPSVVLLRVSVAFRAEHYGVMQLAHKGRLKAVFRDKLGWLVGNLFSRVGSPDWSDHIGGKDSEVKLRNSLLNRNAQWVGNAAWKAAKQASERVH